jgi:FAD/FMN-containing dehydrogenase
MSIDTSNPLAELDETIRGEIIRPGDAGYDEARTVHNGMHDRRPSLVVRCQDAADVMATIRSAREAGLEIAIKGGGHSVPGYGTVDDGVVIDMSGMRNVSVDPTQRRARVGGGALWGDVDHATHAFGMATPGGIISTTGVTGLTLGGGIGHLTRGYGLSCDNLTAAEVVTADGRVLTASEHQNEDLFWALRGGGGNFGVVTATEFQLHPVDTIYGGPMFYEYEDAKAVMDCYRDVIADAPEALGAFFAWQIAPPLPFVPEDRVGDLFCGIVVCWNGPLDEAETVLRPFRDVAEVKAEHVGPAPYPALNSAFDGLYPKGILQYWKADFTTGLPDEAVTAHLAHGRETPTMSSTMHMYAVNGAVHRVGPDETAFGHRDKEFSPVIVGAWSDPADGEANTAWVRDYYNAIHPYSDSDGGYINFMAGDDSGRAPANFGRNYDRLRQVKRTYDPDNVFHLNQNIKP